MLARRVRNRIQSRDGKQICACWCIALGVCVCVSAYVYLHISVRECINEYVTNPRAKPINSDLIQHCVLKIAIL